MKIIKDASINTMDLHGVINKINFSGTSIILGIIFHVQTKYEYW